LSNYSATGTRTGSSVLIKVPGLTSSSGSSWSYFFLGSASNGDLVEASSSGVNMPATIAANFNVMAAHPSKPWIFSGAGSTEIRVYVVTSGSVSLLSTLSTDAACTVLAVTSGGQRLIATTSSTVRMYRIETSGTNQGQLELLESQTLSNAPVSAHMLSVQ
jgi:hypothetical protein